MKKALLIVFAIAGTVRLGAQTVNAEGDYIQHASSSPQVACGVVNSGWVIDVNGMAGWLSQNISSASATANYKNVLTPRISDVQFENGSSYGFDLQGGYFFGDKKRWGAGAGIMYLRQSGTATLDNFYLQYQSTDRYGNTFRQIITSTGPVSERYKIHNISIPLVAKYQTKFSRMLGFTADAGLLINVKERINYEASGSFDYEAIYKYQGSQGNITTVYDASIVPGASDLIITKSRYLSTHSAASVNDYFKSMAAQGYNVGLNVRTSNSGNVNYNKLSVGLLLRPAMSVQLMDHLSMNIGAYYLLQNFKHDVPANNKLTDKAGSYSSLLNNVTKAENRSYGFNVGLRYSFHDIVHTVVDVPQMDTTPEVPSKMDKDDDEEKQPEESRSVLDAERK